MDAIICEKCVKGRRGANRLKCNRWKCFIQKTKNEKNLLMICRVCGNIKKFSI